MAINLKILSPNTPDNRLKEIAYWINFYAPKFGVTTPKRIAAFLAQAVHESQGFSKMVEDGSERYFKQYEFKKNLGNNQPGDGIKFKGRSIFQTTGRWNYWYTSKQMFGDERLLEKPELLEEIPNAVHAAFVFWKFKKMNAVADAMNFRRITKLVNPAAVHYDRRLKAYKQVLAMLQINETPLT